MKFEPWLWISSICHSVVGTKCRILLMVRTEQLPSPGSASPGPGHCASHSCIADANWVTVSRNWHQCTSLLQNGQQRAGWATGVVVWLIGAHQGRPPVSGTGCGPDQQPMADCTQWLDSRQVPRHGTVVSLQGPMLSFGQGAAGGGGDEGNPS